MTCKVCGCERSMPTGLGVEFCEDCEDQDATSRARREGRADARNLDGEIRHVIDKLHGLLFTGQATMTSFEDAVISALNAERRIVLRQMLEAEGPDGLIYAVAGRLGKEK